MGVLAVLALGWAAGVTRGAEPGRPPSGSVATTIKADPDIQPLAAFRRQARAGDAVPAAIADGPLLSDGVGDVTSARRAGGAWIMPGRKNSVCIVGNGGLSCPPAEAIRKDGLAPSMFKTSDGPFTLMGIGSDAVGSVDVTLATGDTTRIALADNAFVFEASAQPRGVRWMYDGKKHAFEFPAGIFDTPPEWRGTPRESSEDDE